MPVRSLSSSVMRWPSRDEALVAARAFAERLVAAGSEVERVGLFGSANRADRWGVGSDLDLVVVVTASDRPFVERAAAFDSTMLPVPADVLVYTRAEWESMDPSRGVRASVEQHGRWLAIRS